MRFLLAIFVSSLFLSCVASQAVDCKTEGGPTPDQHCVVPFTYKGLEFNGCTNFTDNDGKLWCATSLGTDGAFVPKSGQWGYCAPGCPLNTETPFTSSGTTMDPSYLPIYGECGINPDEAPSSIVGGEGTELGEFPSTALLGYHTKKKCFDRRGRKHFAKVTNWSCGGTLINHWYVVTAAHCQGNRGGKFINTVRLGEWYVNKQTLHTEANMCSYSSTAQGDCARGVCLPDLQDFEISPRDVTVHPDYERSSYNVKNNIALIKLPRPAQLNSAVQIACLPIVAKVAAKSLNLNNIQEDLVGAWPTVVGWGYTDYDPALGYIGDRAEHRVGSAKQHSLDIEVLSKEQCLEKWPQVDFHPSQMCAGGEKGKDSCKGDSGGPLYLRKVVRPSKKSSAEDTDPWYLMGLVSFGSRDCGVSGNQKPGFYTRLDHFVPWIQQQIME